MTREAAKTGVEEFLERTVDATREEFRVQRALRGTGLGPGGMVIDRLRDNAQAMERKLVEPELAEYRDRSLAQFDVLVEYMETDAPIQEFEEPLLKTDSYLESLDASASAATRKQLIDASLERLERLGDGLAPVVHSDHDEFLAGYQCRTLPRVGIRPRRAWVPFSGPLRQHREAVSFAVTIDPGEVLGGPLTGGLPSVSLEYTDEALRAMQRAERQIGKQMRDEIDTRFP
ncbi:MAG: hypothetical protein J07HR59_01628 [Halorubrum sp. J07HR59]|nr:MAG: hypothetical protein J07HR59_01628 [Halorubrum sp. J07HR59]